MTVIEKVVEVVVGHEGGCGANVDGGGGADGGGGGNQ